MEILNVEIADFCEDETTVAVTAQADNQTETFYVQTAGGEYRSDLGCWILTDNSDGDIHWDDYPGFKIGKIIKEAESYIEAFIEETKFYYRNERCYLINKRNSVEIVTLNHDYINQYSSSYQCRFSDPIETFTSRKEAMHFLKKELKEHEREAIEEERERKALFDEGYN